jgi:acetoin utilization deacetylase AcuC-like enzyme
MHIVHTSRHREHATRRRLPGYASVYHEVPERAEAIARAVAAADLGPLVEPADAGLEPIRRVHDPDFLTFLQEVFEQSRAVIPGEDPVVADVFAPPGARRRPRAYPGVEGRYAFGASCPILRGTWTAAYWSAQCAVAAADLVRNRERAAYALCRPPGHHASTRLFGGYCYLSNAAIAARRLQEGTEQRVAILDIDYHHGNGTQEIFYRDPTVLFCSLHADPDHEYPFFWGGAGERGAGAGRNTTRNWPLPQGTDNAAYLAALAEALSTIRAFAPDSLVVSAGFDLMAGDPVAMGQGFRIDEDGLRRIAVEIAEMALPTVIVQEGGYRIETLGDCAVAFLRAFTGSR